MLKLNFRKVLYTLLIGFLFITNVNAQEAFVIDSFNIDVKVNGINEKISDKEEDHLDEVNLFRRWKELDDYLMVVLSEDEFKWNET